MNINKKAWRTSIIFGIASTISILSTYLRKPVDIDYAGSRFAYNLTFFFPLFILSLTFGIISLVYFVKYLKSRKGKLEKNKIIKTGLPILASLPIGFHLIFIVINFISVFLMVNYPKHQDPRFTTQKIEFENPNLTLYLHGALYGEYHSERLVYLTENSSSEFNPDTSSTYFYKGDNKVFLFYKINSDTLKLYIPKGLKNNPSAFNEKIIVEQYEYTYEEAYELRDLYNQRKLNLFGWRHD